MQEQPVRDRQRRCSHSGEGIAIGIAIGVVLGAMLKNIAVGIALGAGIGVALDEMIARRNRRG
jgi:hypothetical protein